jgi:hypothetical protein
VQRRKLTIAAAVVAGASLVAAALVYKFSGPRKIASITGAVLRYDEDPNKQQPIGKTVITAVAGDAKGEAISDQLGFFNLKLKPEVFAGQIIHLSFKHEDYVPRGITARAGDGINVVRLKPRTSEEAAQPAVAISNVRVRYAFTNTSNVDVGSAVRTFEVVNKGNVPCNHRPPCSPDGRWMASIGSTSLYAGSGRQFRNVRVSCIAGPCPFTRIESDQFSRGGRNISVSVRNWSDPVTYLLEAEVTQTVVSDIIRHSYPAIFGRSMNFTLPSGAQGPSIEAEVDGTPIVFPLGPNLRLSWADCTVEAGADGTKLCRCTLKPQYRIK